MLKKYWKRLYEMGIETETKWAIAATVVTVVCLVLGLVIGGEFCTRLSLSIESFFMGACFWDLIKPEIRKDQEDGD